ncbi:rhomboid family intramembrane serine protease GlpG [Arsenophonus nasoniae]|uniref:Rhomboid protease GlpG n=2 Tax=Arsenophonus nasoniae TaxID=638 RepID=A0A4P7KQR4_9GAMM|nr:rhomboid family intramembrane serine protease GlpG [Arsenophonus nasoniae]QBY42251.1 Rhomboid protease GlpG [Arsenophonus nasoniae]WGL95281.1 rhomboid family intramembrane serine protease GlpG [Arsenophonus nasoniae]WGM02143.1 rhomboid family intramembrane serine protease GlpG [Arsenophonus nasoniae]WGM06406.1 rhomboid family intramembrane serine protease GlpG [Arsenophonus nasoniae]WGM11340.1 rhomboid family intramembrane serine protease GlpG [Arsenophonus nasoniae]
MIHLISIANPRLAQAFIDYMAMQNIVIEIRAEPQGKFFDLWLQDENKFEQAQQELKLFMQDPLNSRYQAASWQTGHIDKKFGYRNYLTFDYLKKQSGPLTIIVFFLAIFIYIWMLISGNDAVMAYLAWPSSIQYTEIWRIFTPALLHFSLMHILFNLMWWWYLGSQVERQLGTGKLFVITIVSALFSNWGQSLFSGSAFGGLSGVVFSLIGYVWLTGERHPAKGISIPRGLMIFAVLWLFLGYFDIFGMKIANTAHTAGLIIGLLMGLWDNRHKPDNTKHNQYI